MRKFTALVLLFAIYTGAVAPFAVSGQIIGRTMENKLKDVPSGLTFRLSEGAEGAETRQVQQTPATEPLSDDASGKLLGRLPAIKTDPDDKAEFAKRIGTLPAPKTGEKIPVKFPASDQQPPPQTGDAKQALEVVRFSPEGDVPLAPDLNVTFSHPMVAVTSQEEAAKYTPVELTPQVEGRWRWLGTRTLMFDTDKRFPMATVFTARVPAGTRSANGQTLQKDFTWTFKTPPPKAIQMIPNGQTTRRDALMFVAFDQAINPAAVLEMITVTGGGKRLPVRLATEAELAPMKYYIDQAQPGRLLAFRAVNATGGVEDALPADSPISVTINKGTPSAEGPLTTTAAQSFSFRTYGAMKATEFVCGWQRNRDCSPFEQWMVTFTNSIDSTKFRKEMVTIEPAVEGLNIYPAGNYIYIQGPKKGRTTYKVTVSGELTDIYGQKLGTPAAGTIRTGSAESNLYSQGGPMTVLDPQAKPNFSFYSTNHKSARIKFYRVQPEQWNDYVQYVRYLNYDDGRRPMMPGQLISNTVVQIESVADELVETRVDLSKFLSGGLGHLVLDIEPTVKKDQYDRTRIITWLQATRIGLDAFVDNSELVGFATELETGKPLSGVGLTIYPNDGVLVERSANEGETGTTFFGSIWNWISSWGTSDPTENTSVDANGSAVELDTIEPAQSKQTGPNGILRLELAETASNKGQNLLIARRGNDAAFLPENSDYYWQDYGTWHKKSTIDSLRWFVFDDRRMYKPNEEVSVKGYLRKQTAGKFGDIEPLGDAASGITWSARDPRNNEIAKGTANLNAFGAFDLKFKLPDNANLGYASIQFSTSSGLAGTNYSHQFQIQEFRRPEFEVTAKVDSEAPHFVGNKADLSVEAKYYAGGGLANAETNWTVTATPTSYTPPNRDDFTFGTWVPWWRGDFYGGPRGSGSTQYFKGTTDAEGKHHLKIDFESVKPPRPYTISASASVQDVNRQTWAGQTSLLVHPSDLYVGIRTPRTFVQKGEKITVESIVSDIDGKLIAGRDVEIKAVLKDWRFDAGSWKEVTIDEQVCTVKSTGSEPPASAGGQNSGVATCSFVAKNGGRYIIWATVMDDRERFNESEFMVWVPGGKTPPNRSVEQEEVQIIPSQKEFAPGDVAELLVIAPFTPAEGVLTLRRDGLVKTERFTMKDSSITLKIPIDEKYLPNIYAQVDLVGASPRQVEGRADTPVRMSPQGETSSDSESGSTGGNRVAGGTGDADKSVRAPLVSRPAFATGNLNLPVSTAARKLTVTAEPADATLAPGGETKVSVAVKDHRGEPVANSEVAVVIVDESVLALSRYTISDPANVFYTPRGSGVQDHHSRKDVLLGNPVDVQRAPPPPPPSPVSETVSVSADGASARKMAPTAGRAASQESRLSFGLYAIAKDRDDAGGETPINLRENFDALAVWSPSVRTDSNGRATVDVKLPDNLTRYRITAVSVDRGKRFGKTESNITARKPLMVRPSAPRFMNFGDRIELPVVVQNQTDQDMAVDVALRATNADITGGNPNGSEGVLSPDDTLPTGRVSATGKRVVVKANSREEVRFPVAAMKAGTARFQFAVSSGKHNDAAEISLPVWTPATTEAFATYGTTDANGAIFQPVQTPGDVWPQFGGLEVTTSSTQLQELTDAYIYLAKYPYQCSEQISSRMISTAALRDVLSAFKAKDMPTAAEIEAQFKRDIEVLASRQRSDGSFGLWKRDRERYEYPFLTIHVAHALALAKQKGYKVPDEMLNRTKPYLSDIESKLRDQWYMSSPQVRWTISAYALYVRNLMGDLDAGKAKKLLAEATIEQLNFEALGWVLSVLAEDKGSAAEVEQITRFLMNRTAETAGAANFVTNYADGGWLIMHSNRRADGVLLEALIKVGGSADTPVRTSPQGEKSREPAGGSNGGDNVAGGTGDADRSVRTPVNDLIPKLVRGLLAHRKKGHWGSTQENVFILLALDKYFNAFESVTPDFVTKIWLGNTYAGEQAFKGRSADSNVLNIPMSYLVGGRADTPVRMSPQGESSSNSSSGSKGGDNVAGGTGDADKSVRAPVMNLILDRQGAGRLYYRIGMQYAPKSLKLEPADYGFTVLRKYEAVDDPADVRQNPDGSWVVKSGARVRVRLTMIAQARRYHVALVDYLPAGFEILNPALATTEAIPADAGGGSTGVMEVGGRSIGRNYYWWRQYWFEHQNFRDERAEAFASLLWEGVYNYTYVARATTPGEFVAPPAKAEEMYAPETFGRTGTEFVKVE